MPGWLVAAWHWYWQQVGGNVLAVPLCAAVATALAVPFYFVRDKIGRRLGRWLARHVGEHLVRHLADLDEKNRHHAPDGIKSPPAGAELANDAGQHEQAAPREDGG
jgi:hypothetical protein